MLICGIFTGALNFRLKLLISKLLIEDALSPLCEALLLSFPETKNVPLPLWRDVPVHLRDRDYT